VGSDLVLLIAVLRESATAGIPAWSSRPSRTVTRTSCSMGMRRILDGGEER
jgi:hypothetical protein